MTGRMEWERASARDRVRERTPAPVPSDLTYWLTVFSTGAHCADCGNGPYDVLAYRHTDQHALCQLCWERLGIEPKESRRYKARDATPARPPKKKSSRRTQRHRNATRADARKLACPTCGAAPGEPCFGKNRRARRKAVHLERFQQAQVAAPSMPDGDPAELNDWLTPAEQRMVKEALARRAV